MTDAGILVNGYAIQKRIDEAVHTDLFLVVSSPALVEEDGFNRVNQDAGGPQHITHRELSLENVLLGASGQFKICDFGLAYDANQLVVSTGFRVYYMALELVNGTLYDPKKADMWSLVITLYIMLTDSPLLELASSDTHELRAIRDIGCRGVSQLWQTEHLFAESMLNLLTRLLQVDPTMRCESAEEILSHPAVVDAAAREHLMSGII